MNLIRFRRKMKASFVSGVNCLYNLLFVWKVGPNKDVEMLFILYLCHFSSFKFRDLRLKVVYLAYYCFSLNLMIPIELIQGFLE